MRAASRITLTDAERSTLERWSRGRTTPLRLVQRAKIILLACEGRTNKQIAAELRVDRQTVSRWRKRFDERGLPGIQKDAPRGRDPTGRETLARQINQMTLHARPPRGDRWTTRSLAEALGTSRSTVHRVWQTFGITPAGNGRADSEPAGSGPLENQKRASD